MFLNANAGQALLEALSIVAGSELHAARKPFGNVLESNRILTLTISRLVTENCEATGSIKVAMTALSEWLCMTAPAPLSS